VGRAGARFDERRLEWLNGAWIRSLDTGDIYTRCQDYWPASADEYDETYKKQVLGLVQERLKYLAELPNLTNFFFEDLPLNHSLIDTHKQLKKIDKHQLVEWLGHASSLLSDSDFSVADLTDRLNQLLDWSGQKPAVLFSLVRIATTQAPNSPGLADTLHVLGKERSLHRINTQIAALG
jgi:glutamyl-tRNA synthetase